MTVHAEIASGLDGDCGDGLQIYHGSATLRRYEECIKQTFMIARVPRPRRRLQMAHPMPRHSQFVALPLADGRPFADGALRDKQD
jgi:hypothetical protein